MLGGTCTSAWKRAFLMGHTLQVVLNGVTSSTVPCLRSPTRVSARPLTAHIFNPPDYTLQLDLADKFLTIMMLLLLQDVTL